MFSLVDDRRPIFGVFQSTRPASTRECGWPHLCFVREITPWCPLLPGYYLVRCSIKELFDSYWPWSFEIELEYERGVSVRVDYGMAAQFGEESFLRVCASQCRASAMQHNCCFDSEPLCDWQLQFQPRRQCSRLLYLRELSRNVYPSQYFNSRCLDQPSNLRSDYTHGYKSIYSWLFVRLWRQCHDRTAARKLADHILSFAMPDVWRVVARTIGGRLRRKTLERLRMFLVLDHVIAVQGLVADPALLQFVVMQAYPRGK